MENDDKDDEPKHVGRLFFVKNAYKTWNEEFFNILKKAEDEKIISVRQNRMIESILQFNVMTVFHIMTHRVRIKAVEKSATVGDVIKLSLKSGFSRIPVYSKDIDNIIGVIYVKDLLNIIFENGSENQDIAKYMREIPFVTETMKCIDLINNLTKTRKHLAVVVDEYGGTSGIVSLEDAVEVVFGQIQDEYDNECDNIKKLDDNTFILKGSTDLKEVNQVLGINIEKTANYDTIGGFLVDALERIPENKEQAVVEYNDIKFEILSVNKQHVENIKAVKN